MNILIVDDEKVIVTVLSKVLSRAGHSISTAHNGREALELIEKNFYDIVLIDLLMPELNGGEVLELCRNAKYAGKFVLMTAYGDAATHSELIRKGAVAVLQKPFADIFAIPEMLKNI